MPSYIKGVTNLRGKIIPVVDLRIKFGLEHPDATEHTCIIVVQVETNSGSKVQMGLVADGVEEVANIAAGEIEETPEFAAAVDTEFILGLAKVKGGIKTILDIDRLLSAQAVDRISRVATDAF
jgi:purine-binding chemotaxis protein CheW